MALSAAEVLSYLENHSIRKYDGDFNSLLEMIHHIYTGSNPIDNNATRTCFQTVETILLELPPEKADTLFWFFSNLCTEYERSAFSHGILVGMQLMTELNGLP